MSKKYPDNLAGMMMGLADTIDPKCFASRVGALALVWVDDVGDTRVTGLHHTELEGRHDVLDSLAKQMLRAFEVAAEPNRAEPEPEPEDMLLQIVDALADRADDETIH